MVEQLPLCQCIFTCLERRPPLGDCTRLWAFLGDVRQKGSCGYGLVINSSHPIGLMKVTIYSQYSRINKSVGI